MVVGAIGQDSHFFENKGSKKPLMLGGVRIPGCLGLAGNSDADVVLHALTNAVSGVSCVNILGKISDDLCLKHGITDSRAYLKKALDTLGKRRIAHVSVSIEARRPKLQKHIPSMRRSLARLCGCDVAEVGITATSGEGLTAFGRGEGIAAFVMVSACEKEPAVKKRWSPTDGSRRRIEVHDGVRHQKLPSAQGAEGNFCDIP